MKVETVDNDDAIIIEAAKAQQKAMLDGTEPPEIVEVEAEKPEEQEEQKENKAEEDETVELSPEQKLLQAYEDRIQKIERSLAKTNGTYGNELQNIRAKLAEVESRTERAVKSITPAQLKRLGEQYPELAEALAGDLTEAFGHKEEEQVKPEIKIDPQLDSIKQTVYQLAAQNRLMSMRSLEAKHPDWRTTAQWTPEEIPGVGSVIRWKNPAFGEWVDKQSDELRAAVFNSEDPDMISEIITEFKKTIKPSEDTSNKQPEPQKPNVQDRLKKAVLPTGRRTGSHEILTVDEEIAKAAQEERKRIMNGY